MAVTFVQASSGTAITTGSGTVSLAGCSAGNLLLIQLAVRGITEDWSAFSSYVNMQNLAGGAGSNSVTNGVSADSSLSCGLWVARATAGGTCSADATVGASGEDIYLRMYEYSGASTGTTVATVIEADATTHVTNPGLASSTLGGALFSTSSTDRMICQLTGINTNTTVGEFSGETGSVDLIEPVAEFSSATGATATLSLQNGIKTPSGAFTCGTATIGASVTWVTIATAIIPTSAPSPATLRTVSSGLRW